MRQRGLHLPWFILDSMLVLPLGCAIAFAWAFVWPESYYRFSHALEFPVNEIGIAFFFALATKEVVEASLPGGDLHPWRRAALPIAAAVGGIVVPLAVFTGFLSFLAEPMLVDAWPVNCAIDLAACYLVGRLIFGKHPAVSFLLLLALASDAIGLMAIAAIDPMTKVHLGAGTVLLAAAVGLAIVMRRERVSSFWYYLLGPGLLSWAGLYFSGVHPALALVPIVPFMPHATHDEGLFAEPSARLHDTLTRFERWWEPPVLVILFLFGLVNGGVPVHGLEAGMWALPVATIAGRPIGILIGVQVAVALGLRHPEKVTWREMLVLGFIASIGLTVGLFSASGVMPIGPLQLQLKSGALLTTIGVLPAILAAWILGVGRFKPPAATHKERAAA